MAIKNLVSPEESRAFAEVVKQEAQLKRAFECGYSAGLQAGQTGKAELTKELIATPEWVHKTNVALFLWSKISWNDVREWIGDAVSVN